jgi:drug/metabolite transporter (DMT)-like permease
VSATSTPTGPSARVWAALWVVYLVWGSTYLAIRVAVHPSHGEGLPPLLMAGLRFVLAGAVLFAVAARRPASDGRPDPLGRRQWAATAIVGVLLCFGGNGLVTIAEQRVASSVAAVIIATVPIWASLLGAATGGERLTARHVAGLTLGLVGVAVLTDSGGSGGVQVAGVLLLVAAALMWSVGSWWSPRAPMPRRPLLATGMEMLVGGAVMTAVGAASGEASGVDLTAVAAQSWVAMGYLVVFGSMVAFTAYVWLLGNAPLSLVTTYAYVNPLVAVLLGTVLLDEAFTTRTAVAAASIVAGVVLIVTRRSARADTVVLPEGDLMPVKGPEVRQ